LYEAKWTKTALKQTNPKIHEIAKISVYQRCIIQDKSLSHIPKIEKLRN